MTSRGVARGVAQLTLNMLYLALVITVLLATAIWKIISWFPKHKPPETTSQRNKKQSQTEINSASSPSSNEFAPQKPESFLHADGVLGEKRVCTGSDAGSASIPKGTDVELQKNLYHEIRRRQNAEEWAEFLAQELEVHIRACTKAEQRYKQLATKISPIKQQIGEESMDEPQIRTFKTLSEAQILWENVQNRGLSRPERNGHYLQIKQHEVKEWNEIVEKNLQFLQTANLQNIVNKNDFKKRNDHVKMCKCGLNSSYAKMNGYDIVKGVDRSQDNFNLSLRNSTDQDRFKPLEPVNDSVCTDSLDDIKKTKELWENLSNSKDKPISVSSPALPPPTADSIDKQSILESLGDITVGLVKKNSKLWENS